MTTKCKIIPYRCQLSFTARFLSCRSSYKAAAREWESCCHSRIKKWWDL